MNEHDYKKVIQITADMVHDNSYRQIVMMTYFAKDTLKLDQSTLVVFKERDELVRKICSFLDDCIDIVQEDLDMKQARLRLKNDNDISAAERIDNDNQIKQIKQQRESITFDVAEEFTKRLVDMFFITRPQDERVALNKMFLEKFNDIKTSYIRQHKDQQPSVEPLVTRSLNALNDFIFSN